MATPDAARATPRPDYAGFFLLRSPTLPIDALEACGAADRAAEALDAALQAWVADPLAQLALYLASPSLSQRTEAWRAAPTAAAFEALRPALLRYFLRMSTRATPYGLFAATTLGEGTGPSFALGGREHLHRHSWLDLGYLHPLVRAATAVPAARAALAYTVNSTLFPTHEGWRYAQQTWTDKDTRRELVQLAAAPPLDAVLAAARNPRRLDALAACVMARVPEASVAEARAYLDELVDSQVLVPVLAPCLTGRDPVQGILQDAAGIEALADLHAGLRDTVDSLRDIDAAPVGAARSAYQALAARLMARQSAAREGQLFHVDMRRGAPDLGLPQPVLARIGRAVEALRRMTAPAPGVALRQFCERFTERFGDRAVPLMDALDEDLGIGFEIDPGSRRNEGLLADFAFTGPPREHQRTGGGDIARHLADRLEAAWSAGERQIVLDDADIDKLAVPDAPPLPPVMTVFGCLLPARAIGLPLEADAGFMLLSIDAGVGLFGRFARADAPLEARLRALVRAEEALRPDGLFAEIVHLPSDRLGNIVCRPALRTREIVYQGVSGMDRADQITVDDLTVAVERGRVVLRSRSLGRTIVPRLTCAHNYVAPNASPYRFLAALAQDDGGQAPAFTWGHFAGARFLPRVVYQGVVFAPASWRLDKSEALALRALALAERTARVRALRAQRGIPRWVRAGQSDNLLTLDLENPLCVDALIDEIAAGRAERLAELLPEPQDFILRSPEGRHAHELMIPFIARAAAPAAKPAQRVPAEAGHRRRFVPGSAWLYAKLYGSLHVTEGLLVNEVAPLVAQMRADGVIDRWHFVRYRDTGDHLRLRFHGLPEVLQGALAPVLHRCFARWGDGGGLWRCQLDTYERESTRYGGPDAVGIAEEIFDVDSDAVVALLGAAPSGADGHWRWQLSMRIIDLITEALGFDPIAREQQYKGIAAAMRREFQLGDAFEGQLGDRYRKDRALLEDLWAEPTGMPAPLAWAGPVVERLQSRLGPLGAQYLALAKTKGLAVPLGDIAVSLTHMHVNRMMRSNPREHEMIINAFLQRGLRSRIARARAG